MLDQPVVPRPGEDHRLAPLGLGLAGQPLGLARVVERAARHRAPEMAAVDHREQPLRLGRIGRQ